MTVFWRGDRRLGWFATSDDIAVFACRLAVLACRLAVFEFGLALRTLDRQIRCKLLDLALGREEPVASVVAIVAKGGATIGKRMADALDFRSLSPSSKTIPHALVVGVADVSRS